MAVAPAKMMLVVIEAVLQCEPNDITIVTKKQVKEISQSIDSVLKDSIVALALLLHKQLAHHLNCLSSRNPMSLVLLPLNKAHKSYMAFCLESCVTFT